MIYKESPDIHYITSRKRNVEIANNEHGITRLKFLHYMGLGIGGLFISGAVWGIFKGAHNYIIHRKTLKIDGLPESFKGLKIVQISDVHSGSFGIEKQSLKEFNSSIKKKPIWFSLPGI